MSESQFDKVVFKKVKYGDILEDIYNNSKSKAVDINDMLQELRTLIKTPADAMLIVPLISDYLARGIDNDSQLIKMAAIIQRVLAKPLTKTPKAGELPETLFSEEDLAEIEALSKIQSEPLPTIAIRNATKIIPDQRPTDE